MGEQPVFTAKEEIEMVQYEAERAIKRYIVETRKTF